MDTRINVLSLFDGPGCTFHVLKKKGFDVENYYSCEIDKFAIKTGLKNHSTIQPIGDITQIEGWRFVHCDVIVISSPCQGFSIAGKKKGCMTKCGIVVKDKDQYFQLKKKGYEFDGQSHLFWEAKRIVDEIIQYRQLLSLPEPIILAENVRMKKEWEDVISLGLGLKPIYINASLVSAQNRDRTFWTNIPNVTIPENKEIKLRDVIQGAVTGVGVRNKGTTGKYWSHLTDRKDGLSNCLITCSSGLRKKDGKPYGTNLYRHEDGTVRVMSVNQKENVQGLPIGYFDCVSKTQATKMMGNGISIPVFDHVVGFLKRSMISSEY